jgi:AcrR family transcriptional regulator
MSTAVERPLRQDAARNRERLLAAAADTFAEFGLDASVEQIAARAGVGMGTLYRRFPTKQALIDALVTDLLNDMLCLGRAALAQENGTGLESFLIGATEAQHTARGCLPQMWDSPASADLMAEVTEVVKRLLQQAHESGTIRPDVTHGDIRLVFFSLRGVLESTAEVAPDAWRRHLELVVAGLRPGGPELQHPPLTAKQVEQIRKTPSRLVKP